MIASSEEDGEPLLVHPAALDGALQSIILAYSHPNDGKLWSLHVTISISRVRVNPHLLQDSRLANLEAWTCMAQAPLAMLRYRSRA